MTTDNEKSALIKRMLEGIGVNVIAGIILAIPTIAGLVYVYFESTVVVFVLVIVLVIPVVIVLLWLLVQILQKIPDTTKLLLIDDSGRILADFQNYLNRYQLGRYDIKQAADVESAQQIVEEFDPQFAVVDLQLNTPSLSHSKGNSKNGIDSELKGLQFIKFVLEKKLPCRFVILSGFAYEDEYKAGERVKDIIEKTFDGFPDKDKILQDIQQHYVFKGGGNYILAVLDKLKNH